MLWTGLLAVCPSSLSAKSSASDFGSPWEIKGTCGRAPLDPFFPLLSFYLSSLSDSRLVRGQGVSPFGLAITPTTNPTHASRPDAHHPMITLFLVVFGTPSPRGLARPPSFPPLCESSSFDPRPKHVRSFFVIFPAYSLSSGCAFISTCLDDSTTWNTGCDNPHRGTYHINQSIDTCPVPSAGFDALDKSTNRDEGLDALRGQTYAQSDPRCLARASDGSQPPSMNYPCPKPARTNWQATLSNNFPFALLSVVTRSASRTTPSPEAVVLVRHPSRRRPRPLTLHSSYTQATA